MQCIFFDTPVAADLTWNVDLFCLLILKYQTVQIVITQTLGNSTMQVFLNGGVFIEFLCIFLVHEVTNADNWCRY